MSNKNVHIVSLGCPKNRVDSEVMLGRLAERGWRAVDAPNEADAIVINSCGFIGPAKEESIDLVLELAGFKQDGACRNLVLAGCLAQRYPTQLAQELPEVDHFIGTGEVELLADLLEGDSPRHMVSSGPEWLYDHHSPRVISTPSHTAYVKIGDGCDNRCAYCAIPIVRGRRRSRRPESVLAEIEALTLAGAREINLIAQDLNAYGADLGDGVDLASLLESIEEMENAPPWIRLLYLYPRPFPERLLSVLSQGQRVLPYLDLPLQHISDPVLRGMGRQHDRRSTVELLDILRSRIPGLVLRTTMLVGFPGETEESFEELLDFVREQRFDNLGAFEYSPEDGTPAEKLSDGVPPEIARDRVELIYRVQSEIAREITAGRVGATLDVMVDGISEESELLLEGRFYGQAPEIDGVVYINDGVAQAGEIVPVRMTDGAEYDLVGHIEEPETY